METQDGRLVIQATDLDIGARIWLDRVEVVEPGQMAVPAARVSSLVRELPEKQVVLRALPEGRGAILQAQSCEFKLLGDDPGEFPQGPDFENDNAFTVMREKFVESLRRVCVAASRDLTRQQLTGVFFEVEGEKLKLTATDGKRLTNDVQRIDNPKNLERKAIIPNRAVDILLKVLLQGEPTVSMVIEDPNLQVSFGRGDLTAKVVEGRYPDYQVALSQKINIKATAKRSELISATKTAALMTDKQTATVLYSFGDGKVSLSTQASDIGESRIEVPIKLEGESVELRFNPTYFLDALRCLSDEELRMEFTDGEKPAVVRGGQHYRHLVMPLVTK
jgi:DNA polymerase-3 subunit beta